MAWERSKLDDQRWWQLSEGGNRVGRWYASIFRLGKLVKLQSRTFLLSLFSLTDFLSRSALLLLQARALILSYIDNISLVVFCVR